MNEEDTSQQSPAVSVCMVTYNHALFIERAINSVLAQKTNFPFELVIGEDYSSDGTREIVLSYAMRFPKVIKVTPHQQNVGALRNESLTEKLCRGKYIAYCEGDDYWHDEEKLQRQHDLLEEEASTGLVYSDYDRFYPRSGTKIASFNRHTNNLPPQDISIEQIVKGGSHLYILTCTVMLRRNLLEAVLASDDFLFKREKAMVRDTSVWAEFAARSKLRYLDRSLATYTVNAESASKSGQRARQLRFACEVGEIALHLARKHSFKQQTIDDFERKLAQAQLRLTIHAPGEADSEAAWRVLRRHAPTLADRGYYLANKVRALRSLVARMDKPRIQA